LADLVKKREIKSAAAINRTIARMTHELIERNGDMSAVVLAGVRTRGIYLARRLARNINAFANARPRVIEIDTFPFRDDVARVGVREFKSGSNTLSERAVVLVDDVICTGRTARSAIEALLVRGRPSVIQLAALVDRGHRELPFKPDYVGFNVPTTRRQSVRVSLKECDGADSIELYETGVLV